MVSYGAHATAPSNWHLTTTTVRHMKTNCRRRLGRAIKDFDRHSSAVVKNHLAPPRKALHPQFFGNPFSDLSDSIGVEDQHLATLRSADATSQSSSGDSPIVGQDESMRVTCLFFARKRAPDWCRSSTSERAALRGRCPRPANVTYRS